MKSEKIKITFVLPNLLAGGAERVFSYVAQNIDKEKFNTTLLIIGYSRDAAYDVENIKIVFLEKSRVSKGAPALMKFLITNKPDILVTANDHLNILIAYLSLFFPKTLFVAREVTLQTLMTDIFHKNSKQFNLLTILSRNRFNFFKKIICQSQDMLKEIEDEFNVDSKKLVVINNPITASFQVKENLKKNKIIHFITVGRLSKEKGHARILKILSKIKFPFHYTIIGNGDEKDNILTLINDYGLKDKITHIAFTKKVRKYLAESDIFLQGSYFEGFPNAVLESCAVGTPVIAFNVPGGTKEIVEDGINGFLVETEEAYFKKLTNLQDWNPIEVSKSVNTKFNKDKIIQQYEELFINILKQQD